MGTNFKKPALLRCNVISIALVMCVCICSCSASRAQRFRYGYHKIISIKVYSHLNNLIMISLYHDLHLDNSVYAYFIFLPVLKVLTIRLCLYLLIISAHITMNDWVLNVLTVIDLLLWIFPIFQVVSKLLGY